MTRPASARSAARTRDPQEFTDATLVGRTQDGDLAAFEALVHRYQPAIMRLAVRMLHDQGEAEDVVQDTFVLVWRQISTVSDPDRFRGWLYQIATRRCLTVLRQRSRRQTAPQAPQDLDRPDAGRGPEDTALADARRANLVHAVQRLPEDQRLCWVLRDLHDLSYDEVARTTGQPVSTVRGRIARARQTLSRDLAAWENGTRE